MHRRHIIGPEDKQRVLATNFTQEIAAGDAGDGNRKRLIARFNGNYGFGYFVRHSGDVKRYATMSEAIDAYNEL